MPQPLPGVSKSAFWSGWILCILPAPLLLFSAFSKFQMSPDTAKGFEHLGWPTRVATPLGIVEAACVVLYLIPQTAVLGTILLTGYMGGAIATHVRIGEPFIVQAALPIVVWLGLYLRDPRLRALIPLRRP
ncbi:MAG TPA: DoxX family protein [Phycisphaerales bacterium]|nr:DoxX family protein [Phycisphaerales bacterium]